MTPEELKKELTARRAIIHQNIQNQIARILMTEDRLKNERAQLAAEQGAADELTRTLALLETQQDPRK